MQKSTIEEESINILFLLKYNIDQASSRVRGFQIAKELGKEGINCKIIYGYSKCKYLYIISSIYKYDVIFFQKRYSRIDLIINRIARNMNKITIFDIDDYPSGFELDKTKESKAIKMIKLSSFVLTGSHNLMNFVKIYNKHVYLLPSSVNLKYYRLKKEKKQNYITLGWIGNGIVYKKDLMILLKPIKKLSRKYKMQLIIIGALNQDEIHKNFKKLKNTRVRIIDSINWSNLDILFSAICNFDIGLYPLLNTKFNQYKCGYKAIQYMATGIPVVASPVAENTYIINDEVDGFLVSNEYEWIEKISFLIINEENRKMMGFAARKKIKKKYTTEIISKRLLKIIKRHRNDKHKFII